MNTGLTPGELRAKQSFLSGLDIKKRNTSQPIIIAMVGLIGSGKSSVAREVAKHILGTVIEGNQIRVCLRKEGEGYENVELITQTVVTKVIESGGNVIIDSDNIGEDKRLIWQAIADEKKAKLFFIRTTCDLDVMIGRIISADYRAEDFFSGASSSWQGSKQSRGAVVKMREMHRRTPNHYQWEEKGGGTWVLKLLSFPIFVVVDTTDEETWKKQVRESVSYFNT